MEQISRTQKKIQDRALQKIGEKLIHLPIDHIDRANLPVEIVEAVKFAKTLTKRGAFRRQLQFIGTLMRKIDTEPILEFLKAHEMGMVRNALDFKKLEKWRDDLVAGNDAPIAEILAEFPTAARQQLSQLARTARKERAKDVPPKSARKLFKYLKKLQDESV